MKKRKQHIERKPFNFVFSTKVTLKIAFFKKPRVFAKQARLQYKFDKGIEFFKKPRVFAKQGIFSKKMAFRIAFLIQPRVFAKQARFKYKFVCRIQKSKLHIESKQSK